MLVARGDLIDLGDGYLIHQQTLAVVKSELNDMLGSQDGATLSEIRQKLDTSRKYVVPLCEYLDKVEFTRRDGDKPAAGQRLTPCTERLPANFSPKNIGMENVPPPDSAGKPRQPLFGSRYTSGTCSRLRFYT